MTQRVKKNINEFSFKGSVEDRATSTPIGKGTKSTVLVRQSYQYQGEFKTTVVQISSWGSDLNHLQKGDVVFVRGKISSKEYADKTTGQLKYFMDLTADEVMRISDVIGDNPKMTSVASAFTEETIPF